MRQHIVAGNWKMNCDLDETETLLEEIKQHLDERDKDVKLIVAPTFPNLYPAFKNLRNTPVEVAAQNMHQEENGAFTGEVSADMLKSIGVKSVILGHSERRKYFNETNERLAKKAGTAINHGLDIMFCVGESLEDREADQHFEVVKTQITEGLFHLDPSVWGRVTIAYEPVWAIGTGKTATSDQAQEMHAFIRKSIAEQYDNAVADEVSVLYGGSVKPHNANELFGQDDVDGGLIGGASLKAEDFFGIVNSF